MSRFFSKDRLKNLAISILLLLVTNIFTSWISLRMYAYADLTSSLTSAILYMDDLKEDIFQKQAGYGEADEIDIYPSTDIIMDVQFKEWRLSKSLTVGAKDFRWNDLRSVVTKVNAILQSDSLTNEDKENLDLAYSYMDEVQNFYEMLYKDGSPIEKGDAFSGLNRDKKAYTTFLKKAGEVSSQPRYQVLLSEEGNSDASNQTYIYSAADERKAEEFSREVFRRITGQTDEVVNTGFEYGMYVFENRPEMTTDDKMYRMEVNAETSDFYMYKNVRYSRGPITEKKMDETASDIISRITDENYVCYEKISEYYEAKRPQEIKYRFIRKTGDVYRETRMIDITLDLYGQIAGIAISNILKEEADIQPPAISGSVVYETFREYDPEQIILVQTKDDELQYHIYTDFKGDMYTAVIGADTMKIGSVRKSESIYYKEIELI